MKRVLAYLKPYTKFMSFSLTVKCFATLIELALPYILKHIIDNVIRPMAAVENPDVKAKVTEICIWAVIMIVCAGLGVLGSVWANRMAAKFARNVAEDVRSDLFRRTMTLSPAQMELARRVIDANRNTAVVLFNGRPLVITELSQIAPAILTVWQPGTEGGNAAARLLFGDANPCGKLAMTFPYADGQCPIYYSHMQTGRPVSNPKEITDKGYCSRYMDAPVDPLYVFGHGLSYNTYTYDDLTLSADVIRPGAQLEVAVTVKNDGKYDGKEIVQLYIRDLVGSVTRPVKLLKGFAKVSLAPGESKTVTFTIDDQMLSFWRHDMTFGTEEGDFKVMVGGSSDDLLQASFVLIP